MFTWRSTAQGEHAGAQVPRRDYAGGTVESGLSRSARPRGASDGIAADRHRRADRLDPGLDPDRQPSDGRQWSAQGAACDPDGACPLLHNL